MVRFAFYSDTSGQFRWRLLAANNEIVAIGEAHTSLYNAYRSAQRVKQLASIAFLPPIK